MFTYSLSGLEIKSGSESVLEVEENETTSRSAVYQVLGAFFSFADTESYDKARSGLWVKELREAAALLPFAFDIGDADGGSDLDEGSYRDLHGQLFGAGCREWAFVGSDGADSDALGAELLREYDYFGLGVGGDSARAADHLCTECDFMQYLTFREAATGSDRLRASYRRAQRDFLGNHLIRWIPAFLSSHADGPAAEGAPGPSAHVRWGMRHLGDYVKSDHEYVSGLLAT